MNHAIANAKQAYTDAGEALVDTIKREYPVGSLLVIRYSIPRGEATTLVTVTGHGSPWATPTEMRGINRRTGKQRKFYASDVVRLVERANPKGGTE